MSITLDLRPSPFNFDSPFFTEALDMIAIRMLSNAGKAWGQGVFKEHREVRCKYGMDLCVDCPTLCFRNA